MVTTVFLLFFVFVFIFCFLFFVFFTITGSRGRLFVWFCCYICPFGQHWIFLEYLIEFSEMVLGRTYMCRWLNPVVSFFVKVLLLKQQKKSWLVPSRNKSVIIRAKHKTSSFRKIKLQQKSHATCYMYFLRNHFWGGVSKIISQFATLCDWLQKTLRRGKQPRGWACRPLLQLCLSQINIFF